MEFRTSVVRSFVVVLFLYLQYYSTYKSIVHVQHRSKKKVDHGDKMGHGPKKGHAPREKCGTFIHRHLQATLQGAKNTPAQGALTGMRRTKGAPISMMHWHKEQGRRISGMIWTTAF